MEDANRLSAYIRQKQKWKKEYLRQVKASLTQKPSNQQVPKFEILKFPKQKILYEETMFAAQSSYKCYLKWPSGYMYEV